MIYLQLFWSFLQIGLFSIGGGMAALPLIQNQVVDLNGWLTMADFADLITIAEMTPGPLAVNAATFVGITIAGVPGALIATVGSILPGVAIAFLLAFLYRKFRSLAVVQGILGGLRPAAVALIASAGASILLLSFWQGQGIGLATIDWVAVALFIAAFVVLRLARGKPILVMLGCGAAGGVLYLLI